MHVVGMQGLGDNLHHRAVLRELMRSHAVTLATCHGLMFQDLVAQGLMLAFRRSHLRTQSKAQARERSLLGDELPPVMRPSVGRAVGIETRTFTYGKPGIDQHGTILGAMFASVGVPMPARPDFSLPVPDEWRARVRDRIGAIDRPILVHRPVVLRREWDGRQRNPDTTAYDALFHAIASSYTVVSVADIEAGAEWIDGPPWQRADVTFHSGELGFDELAGLWAEAALVFSPAGFGPVLAQAVGTPSVTVFGGRESSRTTICGGAHLAPTLGIDPDRPCDCYAARHGCDKRITLEPAIERLLAFAADPKTNPVYRPINGAAVRRISPVGAPAVPDAPPCAVSPKASVRASAAHGGAVPRVAIVVGGSAAVEAELAAARALCRAAGAEADAIVVNDAIPRVAGPIIAATLHHHKIGNWLAAREAAGLPKPFEVWGFFRPQRTPQIMTHVTADWQGSSGLFGVAVAIQRGHRRIICAGVPMEPDAGHVVRQQPWTECMRYRKGWEDHMMAIMGRVRSMSGWTAARLGMPDTAWLAGVD
jgi:hypothetical protein